MTCFLFETIGEGDGHVNCEFERRTNPRPLERKWAVAVPNGRMDGEKRERAEMRTEM